MILPMLGLCRWPEAYRIVVEFVCLYHVHAISLGKILLCFSTGGNLENVPIKWETIGFFA